MLRLRQLAAPNMLPRAVCCGRRGATETMRRCRSGCRAVAAGIITAAVDKWAYAAAIPLLHAAAPIPCLAGTPPWRYQRAGVPGHQLALLPWRVWQVAGLQGEAGDRERQR